MQPRGKPHELKGGMPEIAQKGLHMASQAVQVNRTKSTELSKTISNEVDESEIAALPTNFGKSGVVLSDHQMKIGFAPKKN